MLVPSPASRLLKKSASVVLASLSEAQGTEAYASPLRSLRPCWTAFLSSLRDRAYVALAVRTFDVHACQHSFSPDC
jgi:hypothetical protein